MICKHCGTQLPDVARFCFSCGRTVEDDKEKLKAEEEAKKKAEEEAKKKAEEEAKKKAEEEAKKKAEEEAKKKAEEEAKKKAEEEAKKKAEEEAKKKAEEEAKKKAEEEAKKKAEEEKAKAIAETKKMIEEEAKKKSEEEAKEKEAKEKAKKKEVEETKKKIEEERKKASGEVDNSTEDEEDDEEKKPGAYKIMVNPDYVPPEVEEERVLFEEHIDYQAIYREKSEKLEAVAVKVGGVLVVLAVIGVIAFFGVRIFLQKQWDSKYEEAQSLYEAGNYDEALTMVEESKEMFGADDNKIALLLADIYVAQGDNESAIKILLDVYNSTGDAELFKKYKSISSGDSADDSDEPSAEVTDKPVVETTAEPSEMPTDTSDEDPTEVPTEEPAKEEGSEEYLALINEARELVSDGKYEDAIEKCKEAGKVDKSLESLYIVYAKAYAGKGDYDNAIKILEIGIDKLNENGGKTPSSEYNELLEKYKSTSEGLNEYAELFENLYTAAQSFSSTSAFVGLDTIALSEDYVKAAAVADVTYYVSGQGFVDSVSNGTALAVYKNEYFYFGNFKDGKRSGTGLLMGIGQDDDGNVKYTYYKGAWSEDLPNGAGSITYVEGLGTDNRISTITTGTFKNGYEDGAMSRNKTEAGTKWGTMEYTVNEGVPVAMKDKDGKEVKNKDGLSVLGYHYFNDKPTHIVTLVEGAKFVVAGLGIE